MSGNQGRDLRGMGQPGPYTRPDSVGYASAVYGPGVYGSGAYGPGPYAPIYGPGPYGSGVYGPGGYVPAVYGPTARNPYNGGNGGSYGYNYPGYNGVTHHVAAYDGGSHFQPAGWSDNEKNFDPKKNRAAARGGYHAKAEACDAAIHDKKIDKHTDLSASAYLPLGSDSSTDNFALTPSSTPPVASMSTKEAKLRDAERRFVEDLLAKKAAHINLNEPSSTAGAPTNHTMPQRLLDDGSYEELKPKAASETGPKSGGPSNYEGHGEAPSAYKDRRQHSTAAGMQQTKFAKDPGNEAFLFMKQMLLKNMNDIETVYGQSDGDQQKKIRDAMLSVLEAPFT